MTDDIEQLAADLEKLPQQVQQKILRPAMKAAAAPMLARAKELCPVKTGRLRDSLHLSVRKTKFGVNAFIEIGPGHFRGRTFYGPMVELGHKLVPHKDQRGVTDEVSRAVRHVNKTVAPRPFLRPAFDTGKDAAAKLAQEQITAAIAQEMTK